MDLSRAIALAQSDHHHLENARLKLGVEVGVRLDAIEKDDSVGSESIPVEINR